MDEKSNNLRGFFRYFNYNPVKIEKYQQKALFALVKTLKNFVWNTRIIDGFYLISQRDIFVRVL